MTEVGMALTNPYSQEKRLAGKNITAYTIYHTLVSWIKEKDIR